MPRIRLLTAVLVALAAGLIADVPARAQMGNFIDNYLFQYCGGIPTRALAGMGALSVFPTERIHNLATDLEPEPTIKNCALVTAKNICNGEMVDMMMATAALAPRSSTASVPQDDSEMARLAIGCATGTILGGVLGGEMTIGNCVKGAAVVGIYDAGKALVEDYNCETRAKSIEAIGKKIDFPRHMTRSEDFELAVQQAINQAYNSGNITTSERRAITAEIKARRDVIMQRPPPQP